MSSDISEVILAYTFSVPLGNYALWEKTQNHIIFIFSIYFRPCDITILLYKLMMSPYLYYLERCYLLPLMPEGKDIISPV